MTDHCAGNIHATAIAVGGSGVLFLGPSGSGKSDLALRCISLGAGPLWPEPARLIADDRVDVIVRSDGTPLASAPASIQGLLEVRHVGLVRLPHAGPTPIRLCVDLSSVKPERLPDGTRTIRVSGFDIPAIHIAPFEASAPVKVLIAATTTQNRDDTDIIPTTGC